MILGKQNKHFWTLHGWNVVDMNLFAYIYLFKQTLVQEGTEYICATQIIRFS